MAASIKTQKRRRKTLDHHTPSGSVCPAIINIRGGGGGFPGLFRTNTSRRYRRKEKGGGGEGESERVSFWEGSSRCGFSLYQPMNSMPKELQLWTASLDQCASLHARPGCYWTTRVTPGPGLPRRRLWSSLSCVCLDGLYECAPSHVQRS